MTKQDNTRFEWCKILPYNPPFFWPKGRPGALMYTSPIVWNLRAVIWFHLPICPLVILPIPVGPSVFSHFCVWFSLLSRHFCKRFFSRDRLFFLVWPLFLAVYFSGQEMISWSVISVACCIVVLARVLANFAFRCFVCGFPGDVCWWFFCKLALINQTIKGQQYQDVLALCVIVHKGKFDIFIFEGV